VAAEIIRTAAQRKIGVGIAARADDVVDPCAISIKAVPAERIMADGRHRPQMRHGAPEPVAGGDVGCVQRARLA